MGRNNKVVQGQTFNHLYRLSGLLLACPTRSPEASCFDLGIITLWSLCQPGTPNDIQIMALIFPPTYVEHIAEYFIAPHCEATEVVCY